MPEVIFARPRYEYDSYKDLYSLITLSGYPLIFFDEIDLQSDNAYIMTVVNGENNGGFEHPKALIILWDLEWRLDGEYQRLPGVPEVWASDLWYAKQIGAKYVPLGSHVGLPLTPLNGQARPFDAAMLSYMTYRRACTADAMLNSGIRLAPNGWDTNRDQILHSTKMMVHVHQNENAHTVAPQRFALAAAYGLPLISETLWERGVFSQDFVLTADRENIPEMVKYWRDSPHLRDYAERLHVLLCQELTFRKCVEAAV